MIIENHQEYKDIASFEKNFLKKVNLDDVSYMATNLIDDNLAKL